MYGFHIKVEDFPSKSTGEEGGSVFLHTDGVPETPDEKNEMIGYGNLPGLDCRCSGSTLTSALDNIMEEIKRFKEGAQLIDDIVLLGFEVGG